MAIDRIVYASLLCSLFCVHSLAKHRLRIQALIPLNTTVLPDESAIPALEMALDDVSTSDLLPNYKLVVDISDTQCESSTGSWKLMNSIIETSPVNETKIIVVLGGACSVATEPTAALSGTFYNILQVSYSATSPALSNRHDYPLFFRLSPSESHYNSARYALSKLYSWCRLATLHQTANIFSLTVQDFLDHFNSSLGKTCNKSNDLQLLYSFSKDPYLALKQIKDVDARIIHGFFYEDKALIVMCYAIHLGLTTPNHVWILPGWYNDGWWNYADTIDWSRYRYNCTSSQLIDALNSTLLFTFNLFLQDPNAISISGYTNATFFEKYNEKLLMYSQSTMSTNLSVNWPTLMYDSVWAIALALNRTESELQSKGSSLKEFQYKSSDYLSPLSANITNIIVSNMEQTDFTGVSGRVRFDINGSRLAVNSIYQYSMYYSTNPRPILLYFEEKFTDGSLYKELLAIHDPKKDGLSINFTIEPQWNIINGPPTDRSNPITILLNQPAIYTMDVLLGAGIIVSVAILIFNIVTIRKLLIKDSAPHINTVIIIGCIVMMATCVLLGIDSGTPQVTDGDRANVLNEIDENGKQRYAIICIIRLWLLTIGFTLSFGALFAKTWQVYRVYTNEQLKEQPFKMWNFFAVIIFQLVLDVIFLSIWTGFFPFHHAFYTDGDEHNHNIILMYERCECDNFSYLIGALYIYKGLFVVFGLFCAYESRNVKYHYINDSRFVSISMYIVVILICIGAPISLVLADRNIIDAAYAVAVSMIIIACMCCLLILYIPKFIYMTKGKVTFIYESEDEFVPVDNLRIEEKDDHVQNDDSIEVNNK